MSTFNAQQNHIFTHDDKENCIFKELSKKGKGDLKEKPEVTNIIGRIDQDQEENNLIDMKRKWKYQSV